MLYLRVLYLLPSSLSWIFAASKELSIFLAKLNKSTGEILGPCEHPQNGGGNYLRDSIIITVADSY